MMQPRGSRVELCACLLPQGQHQSLIVSDENIAFPVLLRLSQNIESENFRIELCRSIDIDYVYTDMARSNIALDLCPHFPTSSEIKTHDLIDGCVLNGYKTEFRSIHIPETF